MSATRSGPSDSRAPLVADALRRRSDPADYTFSSTDDLEPLHEPLGQARAMEAARFALSVDRPGYNLMAVGSHGVGKHRIVRELLESIASGLPSGRDDCYVYDFAHPETPRHLCLPAGRGRQLVRDMKRLVDDLKAAIPAAFDSDEFRARAQEIHEELNERAEAVFEDIEKNAKAGGIKMLRTPTGVAFLPTANGQVLSPEAFEKLEKMDRDAATATIEGLQKKLQERLRQVPRWAKEARTKLRKLKHEVISFAVALSIDEMVERYADLDEVKSYLEAVRGDVVEHADAFRDVEDADKNVLDGDDPFRRYEVNLLVDNGEARGAPVVYEDKPSVEQLVGRVDHRVRLGNLVSDFTLIRAGSLHRANGGFLVVDANKILSHAYSWQALKRALFSGEVCIESLSRMMGMSGAGALEPQPIALRVKVVLIADRRLHMLLTELDSEVADLFKVTADFDDRIDRDAAGEQGFARMLAQLGQVHDLKPIDRTGVAKMVEHAARLVGDADKLTTNHRDLTNLLVEADHLASARQAERIASEDVDTAIERQIRRQDLVRERVHDAILEETLLVDTEGERVGQVNGLWVRMLGDFAFGAPARITATVHVGKGEVVDIEREAKLGGSIHSKGVMILSSFFASRFARSFPLSLSASLVFEQSYAGVEGDSASLAELCALLSALSGCPIKQSFAMTGSVNQLGTVQPIGGVNHKVEGFFDICKARGLAGQGVIIPAVNVKNLMLRDDVIAACREGTFHVHAVEHADRAIELLTGTAAGELDEDGAYPEGSVNRRVQDQLREFALVAARFAKMAEASDDEGQAS